MQSVKTDINFSLCFVKEGSLFTGAYDALFIGVS
jgi:hypothetical protein